MGFTLFHRVGVLGVIFTGLLCPLAKADIGFALKDYRNLALQIRTSAGFKIPFPGINAPFSYSLTFDNPASTLWAEPIFTDLSVGAFHSGLYIREFFDKIFVQDGSTLDINGEKLPIGCIYIHGLDNRKSGENLPTIPELMLKVYVVANDFSCAGPMNQGFPENGGKKELWDTYIYYEIKDPSIMLPMNPKLRYRWNEYEGVLVDSGHP